jgi:hypothetical protein
MPVRFAARHSAAAFCVFFGSAISRRRAVPASRPWCSVNHRDFQWADLSWGWSRRLLPRSTPRGGEEIALVVSAGVVLLVFVALRRITLDSRAANCETRRNGADRTADDDRFWSAPWTPRGQCPKPTPLVF